MSSPSFTDETVDEFLGQEFLTWLWFYSDTSTVAFTDADGSPFSLSMEQRIVVQGGNGDNQETTSVTGSFSPLREAKLGILTGKKVVRALVVLQKEDFSWKLSLRSDDLSLYSLKTPQVDRHDEDDEPDALLLEKIYLMETAVSMLDIVFEKFLRLRLSNQWDDVVLSIGKWISEKA